MLFVIAAMLPLNINAQVSVWDGTYAPWTHGTGTEADPFLIENAQQLAYLANRVNNGLDAAGGHVSNHYLHYKLMVDVDLNASDSIRWNPIGYWNSSTDYYCFGGHFDGNNHTIYGLYPDVQADSFSDSTNIGFREHFNNGFPLTWTTIDADGDGHNWSIYDDFMGCGGIGGCVSSRSYIFEPGPLIPDNWLITPAISVPNNDQFGLSFWVCSQDQSYAAEHYGVYITTSNDYMNANNYTLLFEETIDATGGSRQQGTWKRKICPLTQFAGQNIHIAFRHFNCTDQFSINIDDVFIGDLGTSVLGISSDYNGFFGYTDGSTIENLHFYQDINSFINIPFGCFGSVVGYANETIINNCSNHGGNILSFNSMSVGGIVGYSSGKTTITNSSNTAGIISLTNSNLGGIVGHSAGNIVVTNSYNIGNISSYSSSNSGGVIGYSTDSILITNSYNTGDIFSNSKSGGIVGYSNSIVNIINSYNTGVVSGGFYSGGIIGHSNLSINITNSYNMGNVSGDYYSGGIIGYSSSTVITNSYNIGDISGNSYSGGIVGYSALTVNISNSYNTGSVSGSTYSGGIVGYGSGQILNCYYRNDCGGNNNYGGSPISSANMQTQEFVDILNDGTCTYEMDAVPNINQGYPTLTMVVLNANTLNASNVTQTHATLNGNLTVINDSIISFGFRYKEANAVAYTYVPCNTFSDTLTTTLSGLQTSTNYTYSIYMLTAGCDTTFGTDKTFTTSAISTSTDYATDVSQTHATLNGSFTIGDANMSSYGFEYRKNTDTVFQTVTVSGEGSVSETVTGLTPNTQYLYRTFCTAVGCETVYGNYRNFTTQAVSATTNAATNLTESSATFNGSMSMGDATVINQGFEYRAVGDANFTTVNAPGGSDIFSSTLYGLPVNTFYEYRAFVIIAENTEPYYGNLQSFEVSWLNADTILIYDADMLQWVSDRCNSGTTFEGKYIKLMNNIVLPLNQPNNMTSIGTYPNYPFKGTFDGNGMLISNLYIDQPNTPYQGFFGYTLNAYLYEVGLVNITASGRNYTGGMVSYAKNTYMRDCYVSGGSLFALSYCGGLVGYQDQGTNSIISGCYNTCTVSGNHYVGGLVGYSNYATVRNSYVAASVAGQGNAIGAIIGGANEVLMYNCYFSTSITGQTSAIGENNFKDDEGLTNEQMQSQQFVATLNQGLVVPVWKADYATPINNGFPILIWQYSDVETCEAPTNLSYTVNGNAATLTWNGGDNASFFVVEYGINGGNTQTENTSSHQYVIHNLQNANYYWRVKSVCSFGESNFVNGNNIVTGIANHNNEQMLQLYPNPTSDLVNVQLTINNEQLGEVGIQVFDVYGRLLEVINMADARGASLQTAQIDLSQYAKGVYFVKAVSEGKVIAVRKVVKR